MKLIKIPCKTVKQFLK